MYAVIETGGKQYRVELGTELAVERLEAEPGSSITLDRVLLVADGDVAAIGRPLVAEASVAAEVVAQDRADKVIVFKYRPKARRRVKKGHRQDRTVLRVSDITFNGRSAAEDARRAEEARKTERERLQEAAARQAAEDAALAAKLASRPGATPTADEPSPTTGRRRGKASQTAADAGATAETTTAEAPKARRSRKADAEAEKPEAEKPEAEKAAGEATPAESPDGATQSAEPTDATATADTPSADQDEQG